MSDSDDDYSVGYGRPPRGSQWKKGQSGNKKGRPRGSRGLKTYLHEELNAKLTITIGSTKVKDTTQRLMLRTLGARAASGNLQAAKLLIDMIMQVFGPGDRGNEASALSSQDQELLDRYLARMAVEDEGKTSELHAPDDDGEAG
jgi:hypothetical protein